MWWTAGAGAAGLALYVWLPVRYASLPEARWQPIDSLGTWIQYVLRSSYAGKTWAVGDPVRMGRALVHGLWVVGWEFKGLGLVLAALGFHHLRLRRDRLVAVIVLVAVFGVLFASHGSRRDLFLWDRYWMPWVAVAAVGAGVGWATLLPRLRSVPLRWAVIAALPAACLVLNWERCDRSQSTLARDYALKLLADTPANAHVVMEPDDNIAFPLLYFMAGEGRRPDIARTWRGSSTPTVEFRPKEMRAGRLQIFHTHPPDFPPDYPELQDDPAGLLTASRTPDMPPRPTPAWSAWAIPSFENAPPADRVYESHERELLNVYFCLKARTLDATDPAGADAALARAATYAAGNEFALWKLWEAARRLGRDEVRNATYLQIKALDERSAREMTGGQ